MSKKNEMKYWIFDLDGTIVDSFGHYFSIIEEILKQKLSSTEKKRYITIHPLQIFNEKFSVSQAEEALVKLNSKSLEGTSQIKPFHEITKSISFLSSQGKRIALWTSRDLDSAILILSQIGLSNFMDHIVSGNCVSERKPSPEGLLRIKKAFGCEATEMVMVGDHDHDMLAARKIGALPIRASWHGHWSENRCQISEKQFFNPIDFTQWLQNLKNI